MFMCYRIFLRLTCFKVTWTLAANKIKLTTHTRPLMLLERDQFCNAIFVLQTDNILTCLSVFFLCINKLIIHFFPVSNNFYFWRWIAKFRTLIQLRLKGLICSVLLDCQRIAVGLFSLTNDIFSFWSTVSLL